MRRRSQLVFAYTLIGLAFLLLATSCKKEPVYDVDSVAIGASDPFKDSPKTDEEYAAILHANLFQIGADANELFQIGQCMESIGDKELAREVLVSNFMNEPGVIMPTPEEMRADIDAFTVDTYRRFLVREPSVAEKTWFHNYIEGNPNVTPELVYFSFALSNEYLFY
jgi:hypothetical protein